MIQFERLKEDIKSKKINTIIALKQDRITRSIFDWEELMRFLEENDAYLDCVNDDINTTNANGKMVSRILMSVSQQEIERTSERTKVGLAGAIKEGHVPCIKWHQLIFIVFTVVFRGNSKLVLFPRF